MNLFIFHIHSITPRQSIRYPDIMTKDKHYQLGITVMTLISHNLHTQVIMAWLRKILFFSKRRKFRQKDAEVLGNTIPALMCLSGCMSDPLWGFLIQYPHIFLYTNIQSPSPYAMLSYTQMSRCPVAWYNTQTLDGTSDKIWCIYLKNN